MKGNNMETFQLLTRDADLGYKLSQGEVGEDVCPQCGGVESTHGRISDRSHFFTTKDDDGNIVRNYACMTCIDGKRKERDDAWNESFRAKASTLPGRNDPCHCGTGKKFKKCCGKAT